MRSRWSITAGPLALLSTSFSASTPSHVSDLIEQVPIRADLRTESGTEMTRLLERPDVLTYSAWVTLRRQDVEGDVVWGGDWNHSLHGRVLGSGAGRAAVLELVRDLDLQVPTSRLPHRLEGLESIDHVGVPAGWRVLRADRVPATADGKWLSDHDIYTVDVDPS